MTGREDEREPTKPAEVSSESPTVIRALAASGGSSRNEPLPSSTGDKTVISKRPAIDAPVFGSPAEASSVLIGRQLDHFLLEELIGGGGMGAVFRARDTRLDRIVAVKVLPRVAQDPELLRRFRNEAQSAARLDHPNIARIYDVGQQDGWHYIVFEHIEGTNLRDLVVRDGVLSIDEAVVYTRQIAEALQHAWRRGVVHRDVKPSNAIVGADGQVKLVDMGLARTQALELSDDLTASNVTLGTFDYISPEQARDPRAADVRSDLYSLGCTLYFMLTGQPPYPGGTVVQKLLSHGSSPPPDPRLVRHDISDDLVSILFKLLSKQPEQRYQEPLDLVADLAELARRENLQQALLVESTGGPMLPMRWSDQLQRHLPWIVAFAMLATSVGGLRLANPTTQDLAIPPLPPVPVTPVTAEPTTFVLPDSIAAAAGSTVATNTPAAPAPLDPFARPRVNVPIPAELSDTTASPAADSVASTAVTTLRQITVSDDPKRVALVGEQVVGTLDEALKAVANLPELRTIEIESALVVTGPLQIPRSGLTIRGVARDSAGERKWPVIEFILDEQQINMERPVMLHSEGRSLSLENLHMTWQVPNSARDGGSLIGLSGGETLELKNTSLTIENISQRSGVYAVEVVPDLPASVLATESLTLPRTNLRLRDVVARGQMTFTHCMVGVPINLDWKNGFIGISGRLFESAGAMQPETTSQVTQTLDLAQLTFYGAGLAQIRLGPSGRYPVYLRRACEECVIACTTGLAQIEFTNLLEIPTGAAVWQVQGHENRYESSAEPLLRASTTMGEIRSWSIADAAAMNWVSEQDAGSALLWLNTVPPDKPEHLFEPADFSQRDDGCGFQSGDLPVLPTEMPRT